MASLAAAAASLRNKGITIATPRVLVPVTTKHFHGSTRKEASACDKAKQGVDQAKNAAASAHEKAAGKAQEGTNMMKEKAEEAWEKVKDTTGNVKDAMAGRSQQTKEAIKETVQNVEQSMNTKDEPKN